MRLPSVARLDSIGVWNGIKNGVSDAVRGCLDFSFNFKEGKETMEWPVRKRERDPFWDTIQKT